MGVLDYDHASDDNAFKLVYDLRKRVEELERRSHFALFSTGTTEMNPPGDIDLPGGDDYYIRDRTTAFGRVIGSFLALPGLVAFWPMSAARRDNATNRARDIAGGGYHLTDNNGVDFGYSGLIPYATFDSGSSEYLSRADGGAADWADITGTESYIGSAFQGLCMGGWFRFDNTASGQENFIGKRAGSGQLSYYTRRLADGTIDFRVSNDGTNTTGVTSTETVGAVTWTFLVSRFDNTDNTIKQWVNNETSIATFNNTIFDSTAPFAIGANGTPGEYCDIWASMCFLCASAPPNATIASLYFQTRSLFGV